ncbi:hypothetical protein ACFPA8_01465 [Streptomyces ovatisporus]|uniref:Integral membrane protein n=1 Tax=Streptomyces ovatisporus TaxID=1128682 RepID=A0ABV9A1G6_9ACTN
MLLRLSRAVLLAVFPAELLLAVLLVSGVRMPGPVAVLAESAVAAVLLLELATAWRLFTASRRLGADRRAALRTCVRQLVPVQVRRITSFELRGLGALLLWPTGRRNGVPPGATDVPYAKEQFSTLLALASVMAVEAVAVEVLLQKLDAPAGLRAVFLVLDGYSLLAVLAVLAARVTRPHVVSAGELRVRSGAFFDLRIPRRLIASVRTSRHYDERGLVTVEDGWCAVPVSSQTNVTVELTEPVTVVRPLGSRTKATAVRFFADDPGSAVEALRRSPDRPGTSARSA